MTTAAESLRDMNFKMDPEFHRAFKLTAISHGMTMKELFEASFRVWVDKESDASVEQFLPEDWDKSFVSADGRVVRDARSRTTPLDDMPDAVP
jgi:hypothetical protein